MCRKQNTLNNKITFIGVGIHSGCRAEMVVKPASVDHGIVFKSAGELIEASYKNVVSTKRSTVLGKNGIQVSTVEHFMAALWACEIDNALIEIDGPEVPILDGSALPFCQELKKVGVVSQDKVATESFCLQEPIFVSEGESLILARPASKLILESDVTYKSPQVGHQIFSFCGTGEEFCTAVAPARTFGFWAEVKDLLANNLGKGGNLDNALIFDRPGFNPQSILRYDNEPVRHKMLDLAGDLNLLGVPVKAHILAIRAGHKLHVEFVRKVAEVINR
ncbi:UDP-3-O-[bacterium]|nr:UDP-3-O-[3-hydroxymyristoyl] N-acetylglucosamine deacetylase [bacterium]